MENRMTDEEKATMVIIEALAQTLIEKRNRAVEYRSASGVEARWRADDAAFDGAGDYTPGVSGQYGTSVIDYAAGEAPVRHNQGPKRSKVVVNVIRGKCETAEGRFSDILLPVDGKKNWGFRVTPVPDISEALKDERLAARNGSPIDKTGKSVEEGSKDAITISDVAKKEMDRLKDQMKLMESEVDDQLIECSYNAETRKLIKEASRLGTGILKGPNVVKSVKKKYTKQDDGTHKLEVVEEFKPASVQVSCWNVFPDPDVGEDIRRAGYIWERDSILPRELVDLIGVPGYIDQQIISVLQEDPQRLSTGYDPKIKKHYTMYQYAEKGNLYERWEYYGDLSREDLQAMGVNLEHDDYAQSFSACVVMINDRPIKVCLNTLDTGELPYDFFQWTSITDSPWGVGLPRIMMWLQRIITAAWRAMMDNAGDSSGANIVIAGLEPADGRMEITGKKIWTYDGDEQDLDVNKLFAQFQIENNQNKLEAIIELALKFLDMETLVPMIFQGEQQKIPDTLGATNIMVDSNNVAIRSRTKQFDDQVTDPHLTRYYHWNMQYNDNDKIKGDFTVDARGASVLLQKDQQAQTLQQVFSLKADPDVNLIVDWEKAIKQLFAALGLDVLKSDEEYKRAKKQMEEQPPPSDPRIETAKIKSETEIKKAEMTDVSDREEIEAKRVSASEELQVKADEAERQRQHDFSMQDMQLRIKMMEFASRENISLSQVKAKLSSEAMKNKTKIKTDTDKLKVQIALTDKEGKAPGGIANPIVEPVGKADDGKSFTE